MWPKRRADFIAVACGTGGRPGGAAGGDNDGAGTITAAGCLNDKEGIFIRLNRAYPGIENDAYFIFSQIFLKNPHNVAGVVGDGKNSAAAFHFGGQAILFEKGKQFRTEETGKRAVQKSAVLSIHGNESFEFGGVGQIAARLAADQNLFARSCPFFPEAIRGRPTRLRVRRPSDPPRRRR